MSMNAENIILSAIKLNVIMLSVAVPIRWCFLLVMCVQSMHYMSMNAENFYIE
jgi:hypothetical protein